jgi:hypothetical protein
VDPATLRVDCANPDLEERVRVWETNTYFGRYLLGTLLGMIRAVYGHHKKKTTHLRRQFKHQVRQLRLPSRLAAQVAILYAHEHFFGTFDAKVSTQTLRLTAH